MYRCDHSVFWNELLCLISNPPNTLGTLLEVFRVWHKVHQHVSIRDWYLELYPCGWQFPWFIYLKMIEISKPQLRSQIKTTAVASPAPRGCGNLITPPPQNICWLILILSKSEYIKTKILFLRTASHVEDMWLMTNVTWFSASQRKNSWIRAI
jgi:hypothetical protein